MTRGMTRRQANVLAFALDRQDARRLCVLCETPGADGDPVVVHPGKPGGMHRSCAEANAQRVRAIQALLDNKETP